MLRTRGILAVLAGAVLAATTVLRADEATPNTPAVAQSQAASQPETGASVVQAPQYWFGVAVENIPPTMGNLMKLEAGQGLLVMRVAPHSPAAKAGVHQGDLLIEIGGKALTNQQQLLTA